MKENKPKLLYEKRKPFINYRKWAYDLRFIVQILRTQQIDAKKIFESLKIKF